MSTVDFHVFPHLVLHYLPPNGIKQEDCSARIKCLCTKVLLFHLPFSQSPAACNQLQELT